MNSFGMEFVQQFDNQFHNHKSGFKADEPVLIW